MNPELKNILTHQTRQFHKDTEYLVVFRGGQGGNFLSTVLNSSLGYQSDNTAIGNNEYHSSTGPVGNTHINLWFKQYNDQKYRTETYSADAYRSILKLFKSRNIKLIVLNTDYPLILYTELIGSIKAINNGHYNDGDIKLGDIIKEPPYQLLTNSTEVTPGWDLHYQGIIRHYQTLTRLATAYDIPHISIDYRDIFLDQNTLPLVEFMDIPKENISALNNSIAHYTLQNNSLLRQFQLEFPA